MAIEGDRRNQGTDAGQIPELSETFAPAGRVGQGKAIQDAVLDRNDAIALLSSIAGAERIDREVETANALCELLGDMKYGVEFAGGYLASNAETKVSELLSNVQQKMAQPEGFRSGLNLDGSSDLSFSAPRGVDAMLECTWEKLDSETKLIATIMGSLASNTFSWKLVDGMKQAQARMNPELGEYEEAKVIGSRGQLLTYGLIVEESENRRYSLPLLTKDFFQKQIESGNF